VVLSAIRSGFIRVSGLIRVCTALLSAVPDLRGVREGKPTLKGVVVVALRTSSTKRQSNSSEESSMVALAPLSLNLLFVAGVCGAVACVISCEENGVERRRRKGGLTWEMASVSSSRSSMLMGETWSSGRSECWMLGLES